MSGCPADALLTREGAPSDHFELVPCRQVIELDAYTVGCLACRHQISRRCDEVGKRRAEERTRGHLDTNGVGIDE